MSKPPDKIVFDLVPNDDGDDAQIIRAVEAALRRLAAEKQGLKIGEHGEIDPAAKENFERAEKIKDSTTPKLIEFTTTEKDVELAEQRRPDGRIQRRVQRIGERTRKLSIDLSSLAKLVEHAWDDVNAKAGVCIEIATKVGSWIANLVGARIKGGDEKKTKDD